MKLLAKLICALRGHDRYDEAETWSRARAAAWLEGDNSLIWVAPRWERLGRLPLRICLRCGATLKHVGD